ncbi:MAG: coproporphyrinogen III oxidase [Leptolyngbya sp. SIO1E4]|nr:coproporphyrinogen III oxidase [Leptolyngbya sp. SIO1E4]
MPMPAPQSAYVHIPFCRRRCFYCDFPIAVAGDRARGETSPRIQTYVDTLCREIQATPALGGALETVFFGGGTPSLLAADQVVQILTTLSDRFGISSTAEVSMEMDPGTFTQQSLQSLRQAGLNRVSLGVQSFQDEQLEACGRTHRLKDIQQAITAIQAVEMPVWSLDLISGLPHQTMAGWEASLAQAIAGSPHHISVYDLTVEPGTVFDHRYMAGQSPLPTDDMTTQMYRTAQAHLTQAGYHHYEISNYAQPGYQCQHNRVYWENRPYYGFGMGATSYTQRQRFQRPRTTHEYQQWVEDYCQVAGTLDCAPTPPIEQWLDRLMLGVRLAEGLSLNDLTTEFGVDRVATLKTCLIPYIQKGWVKLEVRPEPRLRLSDPEGFLFSNVVLVAIFEAFSDPQH